MAQNRYNASKVPRGEINLGSLTTDVTTLQAAVATLNGPIGFNSTIITSNVTFANTYNGLSVGPMIVRGAVVKVQNSSIWMIL